MIVSFGSVASALFAAALLVEVTHAAPRTVNKDLPKCPYDDSGSEIQFYDLEIEVLDLPDECTDNDLITIGLMIQDAVDEIEDRMPQYEGEKSVTLICPFPEQVDKRRALDARRRAQSRGRFYKYDGTGRVCRRCFNKSTVRRRARLEERNDIDMCTIAERAQVSAAYSSAACHDVLQSMKNKVEDEGFQSGSFILLQAEQSARDCQKESRAAIEAAKSAMKLCKTAASRLRYRSSVEQVKKDAENAKAATTQSKIALAQVRRASFDLNTLHYVERVQSRHRDLLDRFLPQENICEYRDNAILQYGLATVASNEAEIALKTMEEIVKNVDTNKDLWKQVKDKVEQCKKEMEEAKEAKDTAASLCKKGKSKDLEKAKEQSDRATSAAERAENLLSEIQKYQSELDDLNGGTSGNAEAATNPTPVRPTASFCFFFDYCKSHISPSPLSLANRILCPLRYPCLHQLMCLSHHRRRCHQRWPRQRQHHLHPIHLHHCFLL